MAPFPEAFDADAFKKMPYERGVQVFFDTTVALHELAETQVCTAVAQMGKDLGEMALGATYFRMCLLLRGLVKLDEPWHFQLAAIAARTMFELLLDLKALADDPSQAEAFWDFTSVDKLRKARTLADFLKGHPDIDTVPHRRALQFAKDPDLQKRVEGLCLRHWGRNKRGNLFAASALLLRSSGTRRPDRGHARVIRRPDAPTR